MPAKSKYLTACTYAESIGVAASRCVSMSLSPAADESPLFFSIFEGFSPNLSGQIAVKMAGDTVIDRATEVALSAKDLSSSQLVRESLKAANTEVYEYGRRMKAGGTISSKALISAVHQGKITIGRLGAYECVLLREGEIMRFFPGDEEDSQLTSLGSNPRIMVDLATADVTSGDVILLTTVDYDKSYFSSVEEIMSRESDIQTIVDAVSAVHGNSSLTSDDELSFSSAAFFAIKVS